MEVLPKRFAKYGLTLHPEKTRLVDFGRYAEEHAKRQGKRPATFDFLGFTPICARSRRGKFMGNMRTSSRRPSMPSSEATTSITDVRRIPGASGSSTGQSAKSGESGSVAELVGRN